MLKAPTRSSWNKTGLCCRSLLRFLLPTTAVPALAPPHLSAALALGSSLIMVHGVWLPNLPLLLTPAQLLWYWQFLGVPGWKSCHSLPAVGLVLG